MDAHRFDQIAKTLATTLSRRGVLGLLAGVAVAAAVGPAERALAACKRPGQTCTSNSQCCTKRCTNGRCAKCEAGAKWVNGFCVKAFGGYGIGTKNLFNPRGIGLDAKGTVYVADSANNRVQKYNRVGKHLLEWGKQGNSDGQINNPYDVAVDAQGTVYVADFGNNRIQRFSSTGNFLGTWGVKGTGNGEFDGPAGVAVDGQGNVYVAEMANHRLQKFTSTGQFLAKWGGPGNGNGQFSQPKGVACDRAGNVYVADSANNRVQKFDAGGGFLAKWDDVGGTVGQLDSPLDVAVDKKGALYIGANDRVVKVLSNGKSTTIGHPGTDGLGTFWNLSGVAVTAKGVIYTVDFMANRAQRFARR